MDDVFETHQPHWNVSIYHEGEPIRSPHYKSEGEARKVFQNPSLFLSEEPLPESYAVVLWECSTAGKQSALASMAISAPCTEPQTWSCSF